MATNFNVTPYFDDFDETKQFYKVLFRPGVAVQTREMNQLQSILQNQITKLGDHVFKEGSMVIPGQVNYNDKLNYVKITSTDLGSEDLTYLEDKTIAQNSDGSGINAQVIKAIAATATDPITLIVLYTAGNEDGTNTGSAFGATQTLYVVEDNTKTVTTTAGADVSGRSVAAAVQKGVYYLADHFVTVPSQVISVKKYADVVDDIDARIGLLYTTSIITSDDDSTLLDNAAGTPNYAAPGAHRFKITADFVQVGLEEDPENFFELLRVEEGVLQSIINASQYNILEETLARRTFDESGNYVVDDFIFDIREQRDNNRGNWTPASYQVNDYVLSTGGKYFVCVQAGTSGSTEPANFDATTTDESVVVSDGTVKWRYTDSPIGNGGYTTAGDSSNLTATFGIGKAYVNGYEIAKSANSNITLSKARDFRSQNNTIISTTLGNYAYADKRYTWGNVDAAESPKALLFDRTVGYRTAESQKFGHGQQVGTARVTWTEPDARGGIRVGLSDISMEPGRSFDQDANSIIVADATTSTATTSYAATGSIRYAGNATSSFLQASGTIGTSSQGSTYMGVSGTGTAFTTEFKVGDTITLGVTGHAATSSWTVVGISSNTVMYLAGSPLAANATTASFIRFAAQTVFGLQASNPTQLSAEFRAGDTVYLGNAVVGATGTVLGFAGDNRMLVSSNLSTITASSAIGVYYSGPVATFAADTWDNYQYGINTRKLTGTYTLTSFSGTAVSIRSHQAIRITGTNDAKLSSELKTNDLVNINDNRIFITKISSNSIAYGVCLDGAITGSTTASYPAFRINSNLNDTANNSFIFPVKNATRNLVDNVYTVYKSQTVSGVSGLSSVSVSLAAANPARNAAQESLATTDVNAFFVAQDGASTLSPPITVTNVGVVGTTVTLNINDSFSSNSVQVTFPVQRASDSSLTLGNLRTKTLTFAASDEYLTTSAAQKAILNLSKSDVYRIIKVYQATTFVGSWTPAVQAGATDVTARYYLDDGQRDTYYDIGRAILQSGFPVPTGSIKVFYDYFSHGDGDFFSIDSYEPNTVPAELIPDYNGQSLADVIDFRSAVNIADGSLDNSAPPRFGTNFTADISFFLGRKEKIYLDRNSIFYSVSGVSEERPEEPRVAENNNSLNLYDIELAAYTKTSEYPDVRIKSYENRRYTMKDIGSLDQRVQNLEEVTALSLLESKTNALQVRDNLDPTLERYKTGFFVDNFSDASNAEDGGDARYSIDFDNQNMNPVVEYHSLQMGEKLNYTVANTTVEELNPVLLGRRNDNYKITGDLLTINFTTSNMLRQIMATTSISVAPFLVATFLGKLRLVPDKDIYTVTTNQKVVSTTFTNTQAQAVAAYRATGNWRPYRVTTQTRTTLQSVSKTTELIPYCRQNTILMIAEGLKPRGKFYPFFDDLSIKRYVTGAVKFTFDAVPTLDFTQARVVGSLKKETPRWRSLFESINVKGKIKVKKGNKWVTRNGWIRKTVVPRSYETKLPGKATRDAYRNALAIGSSVWYYERKGGRNRLMGTGVAVHQDGATLYLVNARGKLSPSFLRGRTNYDYATGFFYISVDQKEPKYVRAVLTAAQVCTDDSSGNLYSDSKGTVVALFDLPNSDTVKFITGKKPIVITDDVENHPDNWTSRADAVYDVKGIHITITKNYQSTKTFVARPYDPIAQSFKLPSQFENGAFVTDVDVYFQAKPEIEQAPVQLEIRTCDETGRPSSTEIVPGTEVIKYPDDVAIDETRARTATKFTFKQPVYLMADKNYALVLKSDTKNYRVWIATLGQPDVLYTNSSYTTQATLGSFFKSQDGTLWTEDQFSDLKFRINRAVFSTNPATVHFVNKEVDNVVLPTNPLQFKHSSNVIRVSHPNHGFTSGDTTRLFSEYWAGQYALDSNARIYGIPVGEIFGSYTSSETTEYNSAEDTVATDRLIISRADLDSYDITVSSVADLGAAAVTGVTAVAAGGDDIFGHTNIHYQIINPNASIMSFQPTNMSLTAKMLRGFTYDGAAPNIPYNYITKTLEFNTNNLLDTSCIVLSDVNELDRVNTAVAITAGGVSDIWTDSFVGVLTMSTTTNHVSPALDITSFHMDLMQHRIDNPTAAGRLITPLPAIGSLNDSLLVSLIADADTTIAFDGANNAIKTTTVGLFDNIVPGKYLNVDGSSESGNNFTTTPLLVTNVSEDLTTVYVSASLTSVAAGDAITIYQYENFTEEATTTDATGESKFITRKINLENPATQIKLLLEANVPSAADFDIYYKTGSVGTNFDNLVWKKFVAPRQTAVGATSSYVSIVKSDVRNNFTDIEFNISDFDSVDNSIDMVAFTAFQIKIVMRSSNAARIPVFRNLRAIAHA